MSDEQSKLLLEILREDPPFKRFISRGDVPDEIDVEGPHREVDKKVMNIIRLTLSDKLPRLQPILGNAGMGKTHYFWVLKKMERENNNWRVIYIPSPPAPVRMMLHFYTCLIDECGDWLIEEASKRLLERYYVKKGLFRKNILGDTISKAVTDYPGLLSDVIKALIIYRLDDGRRDLAKRWLFGESLSEEELTKLGITRIIEDDDISLAAMKVLIEMSPKTIVFFIDEIESVYNIYGEEGERKFLEVIKKIYNELKNVVIVLSCLEDIWDRVLASADVTVRDRIEHPVKLRAFQKEDLKEFIEQAMTLYWDKQNMDPPSNRIFPFTENDIYIIYKESQGVPRWAIRGAIDRLLEILYNKKREVQAKKTDEKVIKLTPSVIADAIIKALRKYGLQKGIDVALHLVEGKMKGSEQKIATLLSVIVNGEEHIYAIDIPNVKSWNRSGGVSAFYTARRLKQFIDSGFAERGILPIPKGTSGSKFKALQKEMGDKLVTIEFDEHSLLSLVECITNEQDCEIIDKVGRTVFSNS
ncbi:MAG: hypothetical protein ACP6IS_02450 [Candidatus Asgardarchaeia archaeon]